MQKFDTAINAAEAEVSAAKAKVAALSSQIEGARERLKQGEDIDIDIENATLDDVHTHNEAMNANIADLIMGLDEVTAGFSKDFDEMRERSGMESFIGFFSSAKSDSMREERIRNSSVDDKLQDLISKSDVIIKILSDQLEVLNTHKDRVNDNLTETLGDRETVVAELEAERAEILAMDPKIIDLENRISMEQDAAARTVLETELAELNSRYNELVQGEQVKLARSQTLERYIEKGKSWVDSLQNQAATQMVLINKLQTDTKQRVVLVRRPDQVAQNRPAAGRRPPHQRNRRGDRPEGPGGHGGHRFGHTEPHGRDDGKPRRSHGQFARKVLEEKAKSDERFVRRFSAIVEKHDKNLYGEERI